MAPQLVSSLWVTKEHFDLGVALLAKATQQLLNSPRFDLVCKATTMMFALLYVVALFLFLTGTFGWFGQERDPLSGVFLLPLGLPWIFLSELVSEQAKPWFAASAPLVNLLALNFLCRWARGLRQK